MIILDIIPPLPKGESSSSSGIVLSRNKKYIYNKYVIYHKIIIIINVTISIVIFHTIASCLMCRFLCNWTNSYIISYSE